MNSRICCSLSGIVVFLGLSFSGYGQSTSNILNPQMAPAQGSWDAPSHHVGKEPKSVWSRETIDAAVDKSPLEGKIVTRVGEIIDVSCYLQLGKHGKAHAGCAKSCIMNGHPIGLLDANGAVYLLFPEEHDARRDGKTVLGSALVHYVAHIVKVTGTYTNVQGHKAIYVHGFVKQD